MPLPDNLALREKNGRGPLVKVPRAPTFSASSCFFTASSWILACLRFIFSASDACFCRSSCMRTACAPSKGAPACCPIRESCFQV